MLTRRIQKILGVEDSSRRFVAVQAGGLYVLRVSYKVFNFGIAILLARWLGQASYGIYLLALTWARMLVMPANMGLEALGKREISLGFIEKNWGLVRGFLAWSFSRAIAASLVVAALMAGASYWIFSDDPATRGAFLAASLLIPATVLVTRLQSVHDGFKNMVQGRMPDMLIQPLVFIGCAAFVYWRYRDWFTPAVILALYAGTTMIFSWGITSWLLARIMPGETWTAKPEGDRAAWSKSSLVFMVISFIFAADNRTSTLLLGALAPRADVAIYGTLTRVVDILTLVISSLSIPAARQGIQYYQQGDLSRLQRLLTRTSRLATLIGLPLGALLVLFGRYYLLVFGPEYLPGYPALIVLVVGEVINLATGLSGAFLSMTKRETVVAKVIGASLALNLLVGWTLIPRLGIMGAALSEICSITFRYSLLSIMTWKIVGVNPTIFGTMSSDSIPRQ